MKTKPFLSLAQAKELEKAIVIAFNDEANSPPDLCQSQALFDVLKRYVK